MQETSLTMRTSATPSAPALFQPTTAFSAMTGPDDHNDADEEEDWDEDELDDDLEDEDEEFDEIEDWDEDEDDGSV